MTRCEHVVRDDRRCRNWGVFLVRIGSRATDQQWSCAVHLPATVVAMTAAEFGRPVTVEWKPQ